MKKSRSRPEGSGPYFGLWVAAQANRPMQVIMIRKAQNSVLYVLFMAVSPRKSYLPGVILNQSSSACSYFPEDQKE